LEEKNQMILNIGTNRNTNSAIITKPHNSLKVIFVLLKIWPNVKDSCHKASFVSSISGLIKLIAIAICFENQNNHEFVGLSASELYTI
jgi:hypothetical protein